jgi:hypothetical protein
MMKSILELIAEKTVVHAELPFYQFLRDTTIPPQDRLAFAPCMTYFIMSFSELNRYVLRDETTNDPIQALINEHTYGDEDHWIWFLEDISKLGYDVNASFTESMRFLWSDETTVQRRVSRWIMQAAAVAKPIHRLILVEAIENTASVFLPTSKLVAEELRQQNQCDCRYFGNVHALSDESHEMHGEEMEAFIANLPLTDEEMQEAIRLVEATFVMFEDLVSDLLAHAKVPKVADGQLSYTYEMRANQVHSVKRLGSYLVEAGLLASDKLALALIEQQATGKRLGDVLSDNGWVSRQTIEYIVEKLVLPERQTPFGGDVVAKLLVTV